MDTQFKEISTPLVLVLISIICLLTSACTSTHYRSFSLDSTPSTSLSVDARQRVILTTDKGGPGGTERVVCAEPSPDVFTTAAISASLDAKVGQEQVGGALSRAEMAGALGVRTQAVHLLRDGLYRACEAYMNGVIEAGEYKKIISAYDEVLITLVAVEGLTQQIRDQPPAIGSKASTTPATKGSSGTSNDASPTEVSAVTTQLPSDEIARQVHEIVRDYYCFQVGIKEFFYKKQGEINQSVALQLCSTSNIQ